MQHGIHHVVTHIRPSRVGHRRRNACRSQLQRQLLHGKGGEIRCRAVRHNGFLIRRNARIIRHSGVPHIDCHTLQVQLRRTFRLTGTQHQIRRICLDCRFQRFLRAIEGHRQLSFPNLRPGQFLRKQLRRQGRGIQGIRPKGRKICHQNSHENPSFPVYPIRFSAQLQEKPAPKWIPVSTFPYRFLTISARIALSTASTITPTSAKIAAHILAMPSAPRIRHSTLMPMAK